MKTTLSITLALSLGLQIGFAQIIAEVPVLEAMTMANHLEQLAKFLESIQEQRETKNRLGDAASIVNLAGAAETLANLSQSGIGKSRTELVSLAQSALDLAQEGQDIYQAVSSSFLSRDGKSVIRADVFKPEVAIFQAIANHDAVHEDVKQRRQVLRTALRNSVTQLQAATTHAEVQKLTGLMIAEVGELEATDRELQFATQQAQLLDIQNRADKDRQQKAAVQEQAQEMTESLRHFTEALKPPSFISKRP